MQSRGVYGLLNVKTIILDPDQIADDLVDDGRPPLRSEHQPKLAVLKHDGWSHRGQRALAGCDGIRGALNEAEHIRCPDLGREIVHLIIHEKAERPYGHSRAESRIQRGGDGNGITVCIHHRVMSGLIRLSAWRADGMLRSV